MNRLKVLDSPGLQAWLATEERWAEILEVRSAGPLRLAEVRLGIHYSNQPVTERTVTCRVPKGAEPEVGQHVAIHFSSRGQYHETAVVIDWDEAPQYGSQPYDPQAVTAQLMQQFVPPVPADAQSKRDTLVRLHESGALSDAEFEQALRKLD